MATSCSSSGVVFCPDKYECIAILMSKLVGYPFPCDDIRQDLNPYDETQLPNIFKDAQTKDLYFFFNKLSRKGKSGSKNVNRTAGKGTWHGEQTSHVKYNDEGVVEIIGTQHTFKYKEEGSENDNGYLMTEYRLLEDTWLEYDLVKHGVFCVLRLNTSGTKDPRKKKRKSCHVNNDNEAAAKRICSSSSDEEAGLHQTTVVNDLQGLTASPAVANPVSCWTAGDPQIPALTNFPTSWGEGNVQQQMTMSGEEFQVAAAGGCDLQHSLLERLLMKDYDDDDDHNNNFIISSELVEIAAANPPVSCWTAGGEPQIPALTDPATCRDDGDIEQMTNFPTTWGEGNVQQQQKMMMSGEEFQVAAAPPSDSPAAAAGGCDLQHSLLERHLMKDYDDEDDHNNNFITSSELAEIAAANPPVSCLTTSGELQIPALSYNPSTWEEEYIQQMMMSGEECQELERLLMMADDDQQK